MPLRLRKFIGLLIILAIMVFYALLAMTIAVGHLMDAPHWIQVIYFLVTGVLWAVPVMPVIRWMQRPGKKST